MNEDSRTFLSSHDAASVRGNLLTSTGESRELTMNVNELDDGGISGGAGIGLPNPAPHEQPQGQDQGVVASLPLPSAPSRMARASVDSAASGTSMLSASASASTSAGENKIKNGAEEDLAGNRRLSFPRKLHQLLHDVENEQTSILSSSSRFSALLKSTSTANEDGMKTSSSTNNTTMVLAKEIVSWLPNGTCFKVHQRDLFVKHILPKYFRQNSFKSFQRQLYIYGFTRVTKTTAISTVVSGVGLRPGQPQQAGFVKGAYYHPLFVRDNPNMAMYIERVATQQQQQQQPHTPKSSSSQALPTQLSQQHMVQAHASQIVQQHSNQHLSKELANQRAMLLQLKQQQLASQGHAQQQDTYQIQPFLSSQMTVSHQEQFRNQMLQLKQQLQEQQSGAGRAPSLVELQHQGLQQQLLRQGNPALNIPSGSNTDLALLQNPGGGMTIQEQQQQPVQPQKKPSSNRNDEPSINKKQSTLSLSVDQRSLLEMSTIMGNASGSMIGQQRLDTKNQHDFILASLMLNKNTSKAAGDIEGANSGNDVAAATVAQLQRIERQQQERRLSMYSNSSNPATMMGTISTLSMMSPRPSPSASINVGHEESGIGGVNTDTTASSLLDSIGSSRRSSMVDGTGGSTSLGSQSFHSSLLLMQEQQLHQQQQQQLQEQHRRRYLNQFNEQKQQEEGTSRRDTGNGYGGAPTVLDSNSLIQFLLLQQQQEAQQQLLQGGGQAQAPQNHGLQRRDSSSDGASSGDNNFDWFS